ncbi:MAG TPA: metal-dependent transcriptional regulator [Firmicutes bacterium]|nr:metal-dependent transcriptional regulator [Bacillota bacterium]
MEENLTKSIEDYLEAIYIFELNNNSPVKSLTLAQFLNVSKPAVNKAMNRLINDGFIEKKYYGSISLTDSGREIGKSIYEKHCALKEFLLDLGVSEKTAEKECCLIEHVISDETFNKIKEFNIKKRTEK